MARPPTGLRERHSRGCRSTDGGRCNCTPSIEAWVFDKKSDAKIRRTFSGVGARDAAKTWRSEATVAVRKRKLTAEAARVRGRRTVRQAGDELIADAKAGKVRRRGGDRYKPSTLRAYAADLARYVYDEIGDSRVADVGRKDLQELLDEMVAEELSSSKVHNVATVLKVLFGRELEHDDYANDPSARLRLPKAGPTREWNRPPEEAAELLDALPDEWRALWATFLLAGLRRGEAKALRVSDVHGLHSETGERWISVERGWDEVEGPTIGPKSEAGRRRTLLPETLRGLLVDHVARVNRSGDALIFGRTETEAFDPRIVQAAADAAWKTAELERVTPHDCRHGFRSFVDAIPEISEVRADYYAGHANSTMRARYAGRLRGWLTNDAEALDAFWGAELAEVVELTGATTGATPTAATDNGSTEPKVAALN